MTLQFLGVIARLVREGDFHSAGCINSWTFSMLAIDTLLVSDSSNTGKLGEIFINIPGRSGSAIEAVARDAAILASICLQHGASAEVIRRALTRNSDGSAGGPLSTVLDLLASDQSHG